MKTKIILKHVSFAILFLSFFVYNNSRKRLLETKLDRLKFKTQMADSCNKDIFKCDCGSKFTCVFL